MIKYGRRLAFTGLFIIIFCAVIMQGIYVSASGQFLTKGMSGAQTKALQTSLKVLGYFKEEPTGYFGEITEAAVKRFQRDYGLEPDGMVGMDTYRKFDILLNKPLLKKGMSNEYVTAIQNDLKKMKYFNFESTGYFGEITEAAVMSFQKSHGLEPDGMVGTNTYNTIDALLHKLTLKKGMDNSNVTKIQRSLRKTGFFSHEPTGYFGDITEAAVKSFQEHYGLAVTGVVDTLTHVRLDSVLSSFNGIKIVIDPGHGGIDGGASKGNLKESEVNLDISTRLKNYLEQRGYGIILTRSKDIALDNLSSIPATREERDLNARTNIINKSEADFFISIHTNSYPEDPSVSGPIVFYNDKLPKSRIIAQNIQKELNRLAADTNMLSNPCKKANFYVLRNSDIPGVLVETAFVTNNRDLALLKTDAFRDKAAKAIAAGIENTEFGN